MRSTEFRDWIDGGDGERDKTGTDVKGLGTTGFALAQLSAMEKYYQWLKDNGMLKGMTKLNVTGYSLGGHLATVFTDLHKGEMGDGQTVTFNGPGRGKFGSFTGGTTPDGIAGMLAYFDKVMNNPSEGGISLTDSSLSNLRDTAIALKNKNAPFDAKSLYDDPRYFWASKATALEYGLSTLPLSDEKKNGSARWWKNNAGCWLSGHK